MKQDIANRSLLRPAGAFMSVFSVVGGLIFIFGIPNNSYASGLWFIPLSFLFLFGVILFLVGSIQSRRRSKKFARTV